MIRRSPKRRSNIHQTRGEGQAWSPGKTLQGDEFALAPTPVSFAISKANREALVRLILVILVTISSVNWMVSYGNRALVKSDVLAVAATPKVEAFTAILRKDQFLA